jgi:hypothetical protein
MRRHRTEGRCQGRVVPRAVTSWPARIAGDVWLRVGAQWNEPTACRSGRLTRTYVPASAGSEAAR